MKEAEALKIFKDLLDKEIVAKLNCKISVTNSGDRSIWQGRDKATHQLMFGLTGAVLGQSCATYMLNNLTMYNFNLTARDYASLVVQAITSIYGNHSGGSNRNIFYLAGEDQKNIIEVLKELGFTRLEESKMVNPFHGGGRVLHLYGRIITSV